MDVEMLWQSGPGTPAEIHPDIEAVRLYCQGQGLLRFSDQLSHFQQLFIGCLAKVGDMPGRRYQ
jgi:hypothetical protein